MTLDEAIKATRPASVLSQRTPLDREQKCSDTAYWPTKCSINNNLPRWADSWAKSVISNGAKWLIAGFENNLLSANVSMMHYLWLSFFPTSIFSSSSLNSGSFFISDSDAFWRSASVFISPCLCPKFLQVTKPASPPTACTTPKPEKSLTL